MDKTKKKELLMQWKTRHPEMGVISMQCKATGEIFADISKDLQRAFNSHRFRLSAALHSSRRLQELWNEHGEEGFEYKVESTLKYDNQDEDQTAKLIAMLDSFLLEHPHAVKLAR